MTKVSENHRDQALLNVSNTDRARSEVRQLLVAISAIAFLISASGIRYGGPIAIAADIVLVLCGGWCANQLIRGFDVFKEQTIRVMQAYYTGLLCCSVVLFVLGWLVFLPSEFAHLGQSLLFASTFTTNVQAALYPLEEAQRFDGILDHLWVPAMIAQCCALLAVLYWVFHRHQTLLLAILGTIFVISLSASTSESPVVRMLPIGGLWAFIAGALPFIASNRYPVVQFALLLGIANLITGIVAAATVGDSLFARAFLAISFSFFYVGSRAKVSSLKDQQMRRKWFGLALHVFFWALPLTQVAGALNIAGVAKMDYTALIVPTLLLAYISWSVWNHVEGKIGFSASATTAVIALVLLTTGATTMASNGTLKRFDSEVETYVQAHEAGRFSKRCPVQEHGPLAGLEVCAVGAKGEPSVLVWGDHQLMAMQKGFALAADRANISAILVAQENCIPLDGLQTRFAHAEERTGRNCDQHSAQILQALPHLDSIKKVMIVGDWLTYTGMASSRFEPKPLIRLGPLDGSPINFNQQNDYVAKFASMTAEKLQDQGYNVSVLRQVPAQPHFDAELAARGNLPGSWLYQTMPHVASEVSLEAAEKRHATVDDMFHTLADKGVIRYVDTWSTFCTEQACKARSTDATHYVNSTHLTDAGALSLAPVLEQDLTMGRAEVLKTHELGS